MPKPDTITAADEARWRAELVEIYISHPDSAARLMAGMSLSDAAFAERTFHTGAWLGEQLSAAGCPESIWRDICFANGQRCAFSPDPWAEAVAALDQWKATGDWEKPGPALAERLFARDFPQHTKPKTGP